MSSSSRSSSECVVKMFQSAEYLAPKLETHNERWILSDMGGGTCKKTKRRHWGIVIRLEVERQGSWSGMQIAHPGNKEVVPKHCAVNVISKSARQAKIARCCRLGNTKC